MMPGIPCERFSGGKNMKKLLICCLFGNTANSLAKKMQSLAEREGYPLMISAVGLDNFASVAPAFDGFLIAPHIQYKLDEIKETVGNTRSIAIIESLPYASLDAKKVLNFVKEQCPNWRPDIKGRIALEYPARVLQTTPANICIDKNDCS
jgi:PTS system cellobiose-specific IIB component